MTNESKTRKEQASGHGADAAGRNGQDGAVVFHPLCVPRLETAMERSRRSLVAASQAAASGIEKSIALLAEDPSALAPEQLEALKSALRRSLDALQAIDMAAGQPGPVTTEDRATLDRSVRLLLDAADKIRKGP